MSDPLLTLRDVCVTYPGPPALTALHDADLEIGAAERVVIVGPSGSGKSTLLNVLGLLERPTSGTVTCLGQDARGLSDRGAARLRARTFGFVFQSFHLIGDRTVRENVQLPMTLHNLPRHQRGPRCDELLALVGLTGRADALARHLSGGEKQRVAIARALAGRPPILLCDEPTGNLDSHAGDAVMRLLGALRGEGTTAVVVTHDSRWEGWAERVVHVRDGSVSEARYAVA